MSVSLSDQVMDDLASGALAYRMAFAQGLAPDTELTVSEWAQRYRMVAPETSSNPGPWDNRLAPYLVEIMDCLSPHHPAREVVFKKSAQVGGTEVGINWLLMIAHLAPAPTGVWLPTVDMGKGYNRTKLQPSIDATPLVRERVSEQKSRDEMGSTTLNKKFPGGFIMISGANASAGMQMYSLRYLLKEEISEWPQDVDGRGDPDEVVDARTKSYDLDKKIFSISTPGLAQNCRVTKKYEASDQRRWYMPCPHCGAYQVLIWERLKYNREPPYQAQYACGSCGCLIGHHYKREMINKGVWIKTYPGEDAPPPFMPAESVETYRRRLSNHRQPGFHINQLASPFVHWDTTAKEALAAEDNPAKLKVFWQQTLGEAWEASSDTPDHAQLLARREGYQLKTLPPDWRFLTGACDVQKNRLEWAVYAWGHGYTSWLIDKGIIEGDTAAGEVWPHLAEVVEQKYRDPWGRLWGIDRFGVDAGYNTTKVYEFCRQFQHTGRVLALDGRGGEKRPPLGSPVKVDIDFAGRKLGTMMLWPVGTWPMKSELYDTALRLLIAGPNGNGVYPPGVAHFPMDCDEEFFLQLTAEAFMITEKRDGSVKFGWRKIKDRANEQHDLAVYCRALAHHYADSFTKVEWDEYAAVRGQPQDAQMPLEKLWGGVETAQPEPITAPPPAAAAPPEDFSVLDGLNSYQH